MNLSPQQQEAFDKIMAWHKGDDQRFVLAGYAGAGKTTLARQIADELGMDKTIFCAYTGKAANVLREKGCKKSSTIHGAIYKLDGDEDECPKCEGTGTGCLRCNGDGVIKGQPRFMLDQDSDIRHAKLVIVDEYSMLPADIRADLESFGSKILYLGDPFQLPPVKGECDLHPDFFIEEIHRQALESPIIRFATDVRQGKRLSFCDLPEFRYASRRDIPSEVYDQADQIIVGLNDTRTKWNNRFREKLGFEGHLPRKGDKIICTKNNREEGLFNGMIGYATRDAEEIDDEEILISFDDKRNLATWDGNFRGVEGMPPRDKSKLNRFDFAYAITCHKSQGSEFDHVLIYNQPIGKGIERARWLYTAITRGKNKVTLVQP